MRCCVYVVGCCWCRYVVEVRVGWLLGAVRSTIIWREVPVRGGGGKNAAGSGDAKMAGLFLVRPPPRQQPKIFDLWVLSRR